MSMDEFKIKVWKNGLEVFDCKFKGKVKDWSTVVFDDTSLFFRFNVNKIFREYEFISLLQLVLEEIEERLQEVIKK